ncbi:MAG: sulfite exporter TauE/SafE family protein [Lachnospiraceae bacterium]|nr:sulfite exporter TauE/SafE family protein [Lachnospiraceae bacterium]
MMLTYAIAFAAVGAGATIQAMIGFGMAAVIMAFLPLVLPYGTCIAINMGICTLATCSLAIRYRRSIRWRVLLAILIPSGIITVITSLVSGKLDQDILYMLLGVLFIGMAVWAFVFSGKVSIKPTLLNGTIMGVICGVLTGLFAMSGPALALYLLAAIKDKKEYLATIQMFFFINNFVTFVTRLAMGNLSFSHLGVIGVGVLGLIAGTLAGSWVFGRIDKATFNKIVNIFIGINGVWIIVSRLLGM